jgi:Predicted membrane protein (DUF2232)
MGQAIFIAAIAGLASALLSGILTPGSMTMAMLIFLAPLPLFIAGLGWHAYVAALGGLLATLAINVTLGTRPSLAFLGSIALPTFVLCYAADRLFGREDATMRHPGLDLGRLAIAAVMGIAFIIVATTISIEPDFAEFQRRLRGMVEQIIRGMFNRPGQTFPAEQAAMLTDLMTRLMLPLSGGLLITSIVISGTLGLQITERAKRLAWQRPDFRSFRLPGGALILFGLALLATMLGGYVSLFAEIVLIGLAVMFMLQGLAVMHVRMAGKPAKGFVIGTAWTLIVVMGFPALVFIGIGMADHLVDFRRPRAGQN